jgi:Fe-S-cluster containining protein
MKLPTYPASPLCQTCGGECCRYFAGLLHPSDRPQHLQLADWILRLLRSGNYCLDWWEANTHIYFPRPRHTNARDRLFDGSLGGQCIFLTETGCRLRLSQRPAGCRAVEPTASHSCPSHYSKRDARDAWKPHSKLLKAIGKSLR